MKIIFLLVILPSFSNAGRILFYFPSATRSMTIAFWPTVEAMASRGHEVFAVLPFDQQSDYPVEVINCDPDGKLHEVLSKMSKASLRPEQADFNDSPIMTMLNIAEEQNDFAFSHTTIKRLIDDPEGVDVVVTIPLFCEPIYYLAYKWNASLVSYSTVQTNMPEVSRALGQPFNTAVVPLTLLPMKMDMIFSERVLNTVATFIYEHIFRRFVMLRRADAILDKHFPNDPKRPSLLEMESNMSLAFTFGHPFLIDGFEPTVPNHIMLGMMNCKPARGFKKGDQIGDFIEKSKNGVIYMSFGSVLETSMMEETKMQLFLSVFRRFPQYDFIWKWETEEMKDKPDNLFLSKWLPQMEILAHTNTKLFISLLGQSSFQESLCHQKQVLGIPLGMDQIANGHEVERLGIGRTIAYQDITEDNLYHAINEMLTNKEYAENAIKYGALLMDQIDKPLDRAVWWLEHIMRHPGMYVGKSGAHRLGWIQYNLLDVYLFIVMVVILAFYIFSKLLFCLCCSYSKRKTD